LDILHFKVIIQGTINQIILNHILHMVTNLVSFKGHLNFQQQINKNKDISCYMSKVKIYNNIRDKDLKNFNRMK
jgi:hypothetical protein